MKAITRRLCRLEVRRQEATFAAAAVGDARRRLEERLDAMSLRLQAAEGSGEWEAPGRTVEEVQQMIHAHLEESRIRRDENEKRIAERQWASRYTGSSLRTSPRPRAMERDD